MDKFLHQKKSFFIKKLFFLIILLIPLTCWSIKEIQLFGSDFGIYYAGSFYISEDYQLYKDFFDHKGPFYYLFIKSIGYFIGWGLNQSFLVLIISLLVFYLPVIFLIFKYCKSNISIFTMLLLSIAILNFQNSNSSIAFFQEGLLITSFIPILEKKYKIINVFLVIFFFWLAFFTRIDSIIFTPLIFIYFLNSLRKKTLSKKLIITLSMTTIPIIIFLYLSNFFDFSIQEFIKYNFEFNNWYKSNYYPSSSNLFLKLVSYLDRPRAFLLSTQALITPLFILIIIKRENLSKILRNYDLQSFNYFFKKLINSCQKQDPSFLIALISLIGFVLAQSDKDYHALIFMCPLSLLVIMNFEKLFPKINRLSYTLIIYLLITYLFLTTNSLFELYKSQKTTLPYSETIDFIKNNNIQPEIIGGRGWVYFLSGKKPIRSINDWWLYTLEEPYKTKKLMLQHEKLFNRDSGYIFWIDNSLLKTQKNNRLLNEIKSTSEKLEDQGNYTMFKVR